MNIRASFILPALSCLIAAPAFAEPSAEDMKKAEDAFTEAERLYKTGDYQKALEGYKQAYFLTEIPDFLYNMAQCQRQIEGYEAALDLYRSYLREVPDTQLRSQVEQIIAELEPLAKEQKEKAKNPNSELSNKFKETLPRLITPAVCVGAWVSFGVTARVIAGRIESTGVASPLLYNTGRGFAIGSDLALVAAGVTTYLALKPQREKSAAVSFSPLSHGGALVLSFTAKAP